MIFRAILMSALGFFAASAAALACGTNTGPNSGPSGSYTDTCSTYMEYNNTLYAMCPPKSGGCSTTLSAIPLNAFSCATVHNIDGELECGVASIPASFADSNGCSWYMTSTGSFEINCGGAPDPAVFNLDEVIAECPGGLSNDNGIVSCN